MLVLSRKRRQRIRIGEDIVLTITRITGNSVSIGIEAPDDVPIKRGELPDLPPAEPDVKDRAA